MVFERFEAGGQRGWGGSLANEDAPPIPCKRTCFFQLLTSCYPSVFLHFRWVFDHLPILCHWFSMIFRWFLDSCPSQFRRLFDSFPLRFELHFDEPMDYISTLMIGYARTMFLSKRFKRGLWDAIPLPRTTPDKHENYHQCVCVCVCTPRNRVKMDTRGTQFLNRLPTSMWKTCCSLFEDRRFDSALSCFSTKF